MTRDPHDRLSPTQRAVVDRMRTRSAVLRRYSGGFWATPCTLTLRGDVIDTIWHFDSLRDSAPAWYVTVGTVRALERAGMLERSMLDPRAWCDDRVLTARGRGEETEGQLALPNTDAATRAASAAVRRVAETHPDPAVRRGAEKVLGALADGAP